MISKQDLQTVFIVLYDNNPKGYTEAFLSGGYPVPSGASDARRYIVSTMYNMYLRNTQALRSIIGSVPWNHKTANYTNNPASQEKMLGYLSSVLGTQVSGGKLNINLDTVKDWLFGNTETIVSQVTTTAGSNIGPILGYVGIGVAVVLLLIFTLR